MQKSKSKASILMRKGSN